MAPSDIKGIGNKKTKNKKETIGTYCLYLSGSLNIDHNCIRQLKSMPLPLFVSAVVPRRVTTLTPLSPLAILTTLTGYPRHLCYPSLRVVRNMITINLQFFIKIMTDR